jgi:hypothetical protein
LISRTVDPTGRVVGEEVVGAVSDLPVLSARRAPDGGVVQVVQDPWGALEVHRDPMGRFLSARAVEGPEESGTDAAPAALVRERVVDDEGRLIERTVDGTGRVVAAEVTGTVAELELVSERRDDDGGIVQLVRDGERNLEVRRDPIGRFRSARPVASEAGP